MKSLTALQEVDQLGSESWRKEGNGVVMSRVFKDCYRERVSQGQGNKNETAIKKEMSKIL